MKTYPVDVSLVSATIPGPWTMAEQQSLYALVLAIALGQRTPDAGFAEARALIAELDGRTM